MTHTSLVANIAINISAEAVAWYAAIIATFSAVKVVYDIFTDRHKVKLSYRTDVTVQGAGYDSKQKHFCIEVVNTGKRTVKVVNVGYFIKDGTKTIFSDSWHNLQNRTLNDNNPSTSYLAPLNKVDESHVWYIYALDGRGKTYKKHAGRFGRLRHIPAFFIRRNRKKEEKKK